MVLLFKIFSSTLALLFYERAVESLDVQNVLLQILQLDIIFFYGQSTGCPHMVAKFATSTHHHKISTKITNEMRVPQS